MTVCCVFQVFQDYSHILPGGTLRNTTPLAQPLYGNQHLGTGDSVTPQLDTNHTGGPRLHTLLTYSRGESDDGPAIPAADSTSPGGNSTDSTDKGESVRVEERDPEPEPYSDNLQTHTSGEEPKPGMDTGIVSKMKMELEDSISSEPGEHLTGIGARVTQDESVCGQSSMDGAPIASIARMFTSTEYGNPGLPGYHGNSYSSPWPRQSGYPGLSPGVPTSNYVCGMDGCTKSYSLKHNLQRHQTTAHGRKPAYRPGVGV